MHVFKLTEHSFCRSGENSAPLKWDLRVNIALDVARGLEYLHDGVGFCNAEICSMAHNANILLYLFLLECRLFRQ